MKAISRDIGLESMKHVGHGALKLVEPKMIRITIDAKPEKPSQEVWVTTLPSSIQDIAPSKGTPINISQSNKYLQ